MFGNYAAQAGVIAGKIFASVNIEWDFNNVLTLGFDPFPSNVNDRPRINTWRSDSTNLNYMSGGRYVFYPPSSPTGEIFEPWGDRNTGRQNINIPLAGNTFAGVDAFIPSGVGVTFEPPIGSNSWQKVGTIPNEDQYQYLLKNGTNPTLKVLLNYTGLMNFWDFTSNPVGKELSGFLVSFTSPGNSGVVIAYWNDGTAPTKIINGATNSHTFN
jgi:hypothetical protein